MLFSIHTIAATEIGIFFCYVSSFRWKCLQICKFPTRFHWFILRNRHTRHLFNRIQIQSISLPHLIEMDGKPTFWARLNDSDAEYRIPETVKENDGIYLGSVATNVLAERILFWFFWYLWAPCFSSSYYYYSIFMARSHHSFQHFFLRPRA